MMLIGFGLVVAILEELFTDRLFDLVFLIASCGICFLGYKVYEKYEYLE